MSSTYNKTQLITLSIVPTITGSISAIASGTILCSILHSKVKLKVPYRRLVFALSLFDLICSLSYATSSWLLPSDHHHHHTGDNLPKLSFGNQTTCELQGFFFILGYSGSVLSSCALSIYYYCTIKLNIPFPYFQQKIEKKLHAICILWSLTAAVVSLASRSINADRGHCTIKSYPPNCKHDDNVECERGENSALYQSIFIGLPVTLSFIIILYVMISIVCQQSQQEKRNRRNTASILTCSMNEKSQAGAEEQGRRKSVILKVKDFLSTNSRSSSPDLTPLQAHMRTRSLRANSASRKRERRVRNQAFLYIFGFIITQLFAGIVGLGNLREGGAGFSLELLRELFYPMQGFVNVFVYTYPHVAMLRKSNPEFGRFWAFYAIIMSGGDHDQISNWRTLRRISAIGRTSGGRWSLNTKDSANRHIANHQSFPIDELESPQDCANIVADLQENGYSESFIPARCDERSESIPLTEL